MSRKRSARTATARPVFSGDKACICEFQETCGGTGLLFCNGCGGDLCVCACAALTEAVIECPGCDECGGEDQGGHDEDDEPQGGEA